MNESKAAPRKILIAEDIKAMSALMQTILTNRGFEVIVAEDGEECLRRARSDVPHLILLDIMLPRMHGIEVLRQLRANPVTAAIGVIVCTAKIYKPDQQQAMDLGALDILIKPFEKEELVAKVTRFFAGEPAQPPPVETRKQTEAFIPRLPPDRCWFRLWGTRGSIPVAGQRYVRHGGNTSCLEVLCKDQRLIVDAGSGIRDLGQELVKKGPQKLHILITHTHWDHIQGFPFFAPAYAPGFELVIYGAPGFGKDLKSIFLGQQDRDYFPVQFEDMRAKIEFARLDDTTLDLNGFKVSWEYTHHPAATVGYKFSVGGRTLAYLPDNEFLLGYMGRPHDVGLDSDVLVPHRRLVDFLDKVDVLAAEAQYTNEEYRTKVGWGHSSLSNACALARLARVRRWVVIHHDPLHDDDFLDSKLNLTKEVLRDLDYPIEVAHAHDGLFEFL